MLNLSSILLLAVIPILISGSPAIANQEIEPQPPTEDQKICESINVRECVKPIVAAHCPDLCKDECVHPWVRLGIQCFQVIDTDPQRSWSDARLSCSAAVKGKGVGDLAVPSLITVLADYIKTNSSDDVSGPYWLGGSDLLKKGTWQWIDNNPITGYTAKPDVARECLFMRPDGTTVPEILDNGGCGATLHFVCEKK